MKTKLIFFMKNAMLIVLLCVIPNYLSAQDGNLRFSHVQNDWIEKENFKENGLTNSENNAFNFRVIEKELPPLERAFKNIEPRYSYFWNFGNGDYAITEKFNGVVAYTYAKIDIYTVTIEATKIKTPPTDGEAFLIFRGQKEVPVQSIELPPSETSKLYDETYIQLLENRSPIPGQPITIIASFKPPNHRCVEDATITLAFNKDDLVFKSDTLLQYYEGNIRHTIDSVSLNDTTKIILNVPNQESQINFFTTFEINPKLEIGKNIDVKLTYQSICGKMSDKLVMRTGTSHDPSYAFITHLNEKENCDFGTNQDSLSVFLNFENDGTKETSFIEINYSLNPESCIDNINIPSDDSLSCEDNNSFLASLNNNAGCFKYNEDSCSVDFIFESIKLEPRGNVDFLKTFGPKATKEVLKFDVLVDIPDTMRYFIGGKFDIIFDVNPPETVYDFIYSSCNDCNERKQVAKDLFTKNIRVSKEDAENGISISPDTIAFLNDDVEYLWWPDGETIKTITDTISESKVYFLLSSYCDTITKKEEYVIDRVLVEVEQCMEADLKPEITFKNVDCYGRNDGSIEIKLPDTFDASKYCIQWTDIAKGDTTNLDSLNMPGLISKRDSLYYGHYYYKIINKETNCVLEDSIFIDEANPFAITEAIDFNPVENIEMEIMLLVSKKNEYEKFLMDSCDIEQPLAGEEECIQYKTMTKDVDTLIIKKQSEQERLGNNYQLNVDLYGETPDAIVITSDSTNINQIDTTISSFTVGESLEINSLKSGSYTITCYQGIWSVPKTINIPNCLKRNPGYILQSTIEVCYGQDIKLDTSYSNNEYGYQLMYILHRGNLDNIIDTSFDGNFSAKENKNIPTNQKLYVSPILVPSNDSFFDPEDICITNQLRSTPIVFYNPLKITPKVKCYDNEGIYYVSFSISGGAAEFDRSKHYRVIGSYTGKFKYGENITIGPISDGTTYEIKVVDVGTGKNTSYSELVQCEKMPIELLSFNGETTQVGNILKWVSASEIENDYYNLEHSIDGINFNSIANLNGKGNSSGTTAYKYIHREVKNGIHYYRLSQTDFDGTITVVGLIELTRSEFGLLDVKIFPLPASEILNLQFQNLSESNIILEIYGHSGQIVLSEKLSPKTHYKSLNIYNLEGGCYFLKLLNGENLIIKKLIID